MDQIRSCFDGLRLLDPGIVSISQWRPEAEAGSPAPVDGYGYGYGYGGIARTLTGM